MATVLEGDGMTTGLNFPVAGRLRSLRGTRILFASLLSIALVAGCGGSGAGLGVPLPTSPGSKATVEQFLTSSTSEREQFCKRFWNNPLSILDQLIDIEREYDDSQVTEQLTQYFLDYCGEILKF